MQSLGQKLQQARLAKKITLEEAARVTKIRQSRLQEIENEDFSGFSSLAYAKGFLLIYGKFLDVDVTPHLDAFETSNHVSVDGYSYLQEGPSSCAATDRAPGSGETPGTPPFYRRAGGSRARLLSRQAAARHSTHHAVAFCHAGRGRFRDTPALHPAAWKHCRAPRSSGGRHAPGRGARRGDAADHLGSGEAFRDRTGSTPRGAGPSRRFGRA